MWRKLAIPNKRIKVRAVNVLKKNRESQEFLIVDSNVRPSQKKITYNVDRLTCLAIIKWSWPRPGNQTKGEDDTQFPFHNHIAKEKRVALMRVYLMLYASI
ncbi:unnamed protein product [Amoebophrya sp. A25]|nr:unnamed protein product [Amoebophrya sp. A25]|eukprot:GSA25T00027469001.1